MVLRVHVLYNARVAQLVEYDLAKVGVAGSSPVSRSQEYGFRVIRDPLFVCINEITESFYLKKTLED